MSSGNSMKQHRGSEVDAMEEEKPETMSSNTKTRTAAEAAAAATSRAAAATSRAAAASKGLNKRSNSSSSSGSDDDDDDDDSGGGGGGDAMDDGDDGDLAGKRKVDDFLRREELAMDARFKAVVVMPGDDVTESTTRTTKSLRLGPGLMQHGRDKVVATRMGVLRYRPPCSFWVESNGRRYRARVEDQVLGVVEDKTAEAYRVNVFGSCAAVLGVQEFDGASKQNRPNLKTGSLVFCRVAVVNKDMETELTCTSTHHGSRKAWMTGESTFGELHGGKMERCSLLLAKSLTKPNCRVLTSLAKYIPFEIAAGLNGTFWVDSGSEDHTIVICNAILNSEVMTDEQTDAMVDRLAKHIKKGLDAM